jgi:hypothetical protein
MPESGSEGGARWVVGAAAGLAAAGLFTWWLWEPGPAGFGRDGGGASSGATTSPVPDAPADAARSGAALPSLPRIASGGRLSLAAGELPDSRPLALSLELEDDARIASGHEVRMVSEDGRRIELTATPQPGPGSGLRLEIQPDFLEPGRYMIQIETAETHPLGIRRYVLEIR